jgi:hypothetical protein
MKTSSPRHPVDELSVQEKCLIYFSRVVDLAVAQALLDPGRDAEIGHFVFSRSYTEGRDLDVRLRELLRDFEARHPEVAAARRNDKNVALAGAVEAFINSEDREKIRQLILVGASQRVWPAGTSHVLTYPWDLAGNGRQVRFRDDLTEFTKRRVLKILEKAGKLGSRDLFGRQ